MTQAERARPMKYALAESSRWLLNKRRDTKINIPECWEKIRKEKKQNEKRKVGSKAQKQASKKTILKAYR